MPCTTPHRNYFWILAATGLLAIGHATEAQEPDRFTFGKAVKVFPDGTIQVRTGAKVETLPLLGVAFPHPDQPGHHAAITALSKLVLQQGVRYAVQEIGGKKFFRLRVGDIWANLAMIEAGAAWHDPKQIASESLAAAQATAQKNKVGLWALPEPIAPWEWPEKRIEALTRAKEIAAAERKKMWETAREGIPASEREAALAILAKAVAAMGGEAKLSALKQASWKFEVTTKPADSFGFIWMSLLGAPPQGADEPKAAVSAWWERDERLRFDFGASPELKFVLDPQCTTKLGGYLTLDEIYLFHRVIDAKGNERLIQPEFFKPEHLAPAKESVPMLRTALREFQAFFQLAPLSGSGYLLRKAPPRAGDDRPAILVASEGLESSSGAATISWLRFTFNATHAGLEEFSVESDPTGTLFLTDHREVNGLKIWTKAEMKVGAMLDVTLKTLDLRALEGPIAELNPPKEAKPLIELLKDPRGKRPGR